MVYLVDLLCIHYIKLLAKLVHLEKISLNWFFPILYVLLCLRNVICETLEVSYSMVDKVLLFLGFDIPKNYYSHFLLCY